MGKVKDGKAIQICASSFIPHLASDILKNECLLSSPPEETILSLKASSSGWVYILWAIAVASLLPPSTEAKKPFVSTLRRINREEERQPQQRGRDIRHRKGIRGAICMRGNTSGRPSVHPNFWVSIGSPRPWSTLHLLLLLLLLSSSSCSHLAFVTGGLPGPRGAAAALAKCSEMRGIWVDSGEGGREAVSGCGWNLSCISTSPR